MKSVAHARIFENTQFLYELQLASLETRVLTGACEVGEDFRSLFLAESGRSELLARTSYVAEIENELSDYRRLTKFNATRSMNQYITHWFYPYKGKFHPQMARALANIIGLRKGDCVLDPFCGSGTTAVEGALLGLQTICFDISPLCALIAKVKANAVHHITAIARAKKYDRLPSARVEDIPIARALRTPTEGFESLARLISLSDQTRRRRDYAQALVENRRKMRLSVDLMARGCDEIGIAPIPARVEVADARRLPLADESVDGVVTSPPYSIALNYVANDAHSLTALGYDLARAREDFIGVRGQGESRLAFFDEDMRLAYAEIARVLKPGGGAAIVLGNATVNGREIDAVGNCVAFFERAGLLLSQKINKIIFGLYNVMQRESILIFRKESEAK